MWWKWRKRWLSSPAPMLASQTFALRSPNIHRGNGIQALSCRSAVSTIQRRSSCDDGLGRWCALSTGMENRACTNPSAAPKMKAQVMGDTGVWVGTDTDFLEQRSDQREQRDGVLFEIGCTESRALKDRELAPACRRCCSTHPSNRRRQMTFKPGLFPKHWHGGRGRSPAKKQAQ